MEVKNIDQRQIIKVPADLAGKRLDQALACLFPAYSRARLQRWIKQGAVLVDGEQLRAKDTVLGGERIELTAIEQQETPWKAQEIPLDVVFEDESIIVVNKPAGLVVHPGAGNDQGTMANALLHHYPELAAVPRAGVIHRLDKDTSGVIVVARNLTAQKALVVQLQARAFDREYEAVCVGVMTAGGTIDAPICRHPVNRLRMAVVERGVDRGKEAITHYRVIERYRAHTHIRVKLETGRTHQIRVHMAHIHYPLLGDPLYGGRLRIPVACSGGFKDILRGFNRQALHAVHLGLHHPESGQLLQWQVPLPDDLRQLMEAVKEDNKI